MAFPGKLLMLRPPSRYEANRAALPLRSAIVDCGVRPPNMVSFASSALRSMMLGVPVVITFFGSAVRGSLTSLSMWSPGSVALQVVPPSAE